MLAYLLLGLLIHRRTFWVNLLALFAGTVIYALLRSIPYAGWIIDLLVTAAGMGAAWLAYRQFRLTPPENTERVEKKTVRKKPGVGR
jgi:hypothetical protein